MQKPPIAKSGINTTTPKFKPNQIPARQQTMVIIATAPAWLIRINRVAVHPG